MRVVFRLTLLIVVGTAALLMLTAGPMFGQAIIRRGDVPGVELSTEQRQRIYEIRQQTRRELRQIQRDPSLSPEQKEMRFDSALANMHRRVLNELTPTQRRQFEQWWQSRIEEPLSRRAGAGPGEQEPLLYRVPGVPPSSLTSAQKQRIAEIRLNTIDRVQAIEDDPKLSETQKMDQIEQARFEGHTQVVGVLTPEQRQQFENWWQGR